MTSVNLVVYYHPCFVLLLLCIFTHICISFVTHIIIETTVTMVITVIMASERDEWRVMSVCVNVFVCVRIKKPSLGIWHPSILTGQPVAIAT